jgi:hydrogenase maturation protease
MLNDAATPMMPPRILIACIGNIFLGDDAFGVEVARRLAGRSLPPGVRVFDFGIRGMDLAFALLDDATDIVLMVDAVPRGEPPGTLYVIELDWNEAEEPDRSLTLPLEPHALDPARVMRLVSSLGGRAKRLLVLGCEPTPLDPEDDPMVELSAPVRAAVDEAVLMIDSLVGRIRSGGYPDAEAAESLSEVTSNHGEHLS